MLRGYLVRGVDTDCTLSACITMAFQQTSRIDVQLRVPVVRDASQGMEKVGLLPGDNADVFWRGAAHTCNALAAVASPTASACRPLAATSAAAVNEEASMFASSSSWPSLNLHSEVISTSKPAERNNSSWL